MGREYQCLRRQQFDRHVFEEVRAYWEEGCEIGKSYAIKGVDGVILDLKCTDEGEEKPPRRELLLKLQDGKVASYPPLHVLKRCSSLKDAATKPFEPKCDFNSRLYRTPPFPNTDPGSYQELRFTNGLADGDIELTEIRQARPVWKAHGTFTCSNGFSICRVNFPVMLGDPEELPFEQVASDGNSPEMIVVPSFQQDVYQIQRNAVSVGKKYGGLVVDFLNGFSLKEDELTAPANVYRYAECAPK